MARARRAQHNGFPRKLLKKGPQACHDYFLAHKAEHPVMRHLQRQILKTVSGPGTASTILVVGPAGAGKTALLRALEDALTKKFLKAMACDPDFRPFTAINAPIPYNGKYHWKDHFVRSLQALNGPSYSTRSTTEELHDAYESSLRSHHLRVFFIDDGQHLARAKDPKKELEVLTTLAEKTGVPHVIFGSYDLVWVLDTLPVLSRSIPLFELPRYRWDAKGKTAYDEVIRSFQRNLPLPKRFNMLPHREFLYERTIGCVGVLKSWLTRALDLTMKQGRDSLTLKVLEETSLKNGQLSHMLDGAEQGEKQLRDFEGKSARDKVHGRMRPGKQAPLISSYSPATITNERDR